MRILILTQYFPPETGAPQNRLLGLAIQLRKAGDSPFVLTAMPNYPVMQIYPQYKSKWKVKEQINHIPVVRAWIYVSKSKSVVKRLINYFSFVFSSWIVSFSIKEEFDYVLCESPPLFLGVSGWLISKRKKAKFIFNVSDLWPESAEKLGIISNKFFLNAAKQLEEFLYKHSFLITGQTQGIAKNISARFPQNQVHWLPNGIDANPNQMQNSNWRIQNGFGKNDFLLLYAGIIGHAQGLEVILNAAALLKSNSQIKFILIGDGPEKEKLLALKTSLELESVFFHDVLPKEKLYEAINAVNAGIIPLRKIELFLGAVPSKIFENLLMKKPILLGVDGEAKELFIERKRCGLYFTPEDPGELANAITELSLNSGLVKELGENGYQYVMSSFSRRKITNDFRKLLVR